MGQGWNVPSWANNVLAPPVPSSLTPKSLYWEKFGYQTAYLIILGGFLKIAIDFLELIN